MASLSVGRAKMSSTTTPSVHFPFLHQVTFVHIIQLLSALCQAVGLTCIYRYDILVQLSFDVVLLINENLGRLDSMLYFPDLIELSLRGPECLTDQENMQGYDFTQFQTKIGPGKEIFFATSCIERAWGSIYL